MDFVQKERVAPILAAIIVCCGLITPATAQTEVAGISVSGPVAPLVTVPDPQPRWGTTTDAIQIHYGGSFVASTNTNTWNNSQGNLYRTGGGFYYDANADLPAGAEITAFQLEGCDVSATAHIGAYFFVLNSPGDVANLIANVATTDADAPGCTFVSSPPAALYKFVDRLNKRYLIRIEFNGTTSETRIGAVRVFYKLRVSPAPASATFTDVPTSHPFFQYIEALSAAGITGGCTATPLQYCPDQPVTRGQMAVFISRALGLHFPN